MELHGTNARLYLDGVPLEGLKSISWEAPGEALEVESLDATMSMITFDDAHIDLAKRARRYDPVEEAEHWAEEASWDQWYFNEDLEKKYVEHK